MFPHNEPFHFYHVNNKDIETYVAIVVAAQKELLKEFPGLEFHVIYWQDKENEKQDRMILESFQKEGIKVHLITDILPDYYKRRFDYAISVFDPHPNLMANKYIANYVIRHILGIKNKDLSIRTGVVEMKG